MIHPSAIIEDGAQLGADVTVGPFCVVGPKVVLGDRVALKSHVVITGETQVGADTVIFPFCCIGEIPQDVKFKGEAAKLVIGQRNRIREHVTMNPGTQAGGGMTSVGDDGFFLAGCHVAHDARVGDRVIIVNQSAVAGHCVIEDDVIIGGLCGIHQFVRIGRGAIIGALSMVTKDVMPHGLVMGPRGELDGLNLIGLKRRGVSREDISALRIAFLTLKDGDGSFMDRARRLNDEMDSEYVSQMVNFILADTDRHYLTPR
ncbi:acyl-ACP--UDP-N-acetylglucosamine O-acyltransferase [Octadecabacter sp.]|nr:acyl-ACP--UDP-N-acetylglucosamine O-acyltransferase [Octadecabacter sp.]